MVTTRTPTARAHRRAARRPRTVPAAAASTPSPSMPITVSPFTLTATSAPCTAACTTARRAAICIPPISTPPSACVTNSDMAAFVKRRHGLFSRDHEHGLRTVWSVTPNRERDAWGMAATMDHSDIRGLGTALHLFLAGLPRSRSGDHPKNRVRWCSHKIFEDSPHRSHASRSRLSVLLEVRVLGDRAPLVVAGIKKDLRVHFHMARHVPDEAGEFAGDSDADFVLCQLSSYRETAPALGQTQLRLPGDIADDLRLPLLANLETSSDLSFEAIIPGRLHQDTSSMFVAALGDLPLTAGVAAGELRGYQSQVRHQRTRMGKPGQIAHLGDKNDRGNEVKALQTHQRLDHWIHAPAFALHSQLLGDSLDSLAGLLRGLSIFVEGNLLCRMLEADRRQVPIVRVAPGTLSLVMAPMAQHHRLDLQAHPMPRSARIFSSANEVSDRLVAFIGHNDARQIPGARLARQQQRIAPVRLDALLRGLSRNSGGRDDIASPALLAQVAYPTVAAGPGLVHDQRTFLGAHSAHRFAQLGRKRIDRADESRRSTIRIRDPYRYRDRFLMNIQSNIGSGRLFHGLSPDGFGSTIPSGTLHVARRTHLRNPRYRRQTTSKIFNTCRTPMRTCGHDV